MTHQRGFLRLIPRLHPLSSTLYSFGIFSYWVLLTDLNTDFERGRIWLLTFTLGLGHGSSQIVSIIPRPVVTV